MISSDSAEFTTPAGEKIFLKPLTQAELPGLEWDGQYIHFRKLYAQHFASTLSGTTRIWGATDSTGKVIGQVFILLYAKDKELADGQHRAYLFSFRVREEWRNQGIGSFIMDFAEEYLGSRGFSWLRLNVAQNNLKAIALYKKRGYQIIGEEAGNWRYQDHNNVWQNVHEPAWQMIKALKAG
ncbi:MAG: GNAT family N-acetyltransferase [Anaerolineaceae bacterium]|nr:GNAT family N-acetyltransferase [Anaerolineaceae bacterium]